MDEAAAIHRLKRIFPDRSENFLRQEFRNCNDDLNRTIEAVNNNMLSSRSPSSREGSSLFGKLCISVFDTLYRFCCCLEEAKVKDENEFVAGTSRRSTERAAPIVREPKPQRRSKEEARRSVRRSSEVKFPVHSKESTKSVAQQLKIIQGLEARKGSRDAIKRGSIGEKDKTEAQIKDEHEFVAGTSRRSTERAIPIIGYEPIPRRSKEETRRSVRRSSEVKFPVYSKESTKSLAQQLKIIQALEARKGSRDPIMQGNMGSIGEKDKTEVQIKDEHEFVAGTSRRSTERAVSIDYEPIPRRSKEETRRSVRRSSEVKFPVHSKESTEGLAQQLKIIQGLEARKGLRDAIKQDGEEDQTDAFGHPATHYRELARLHARKRDEYFQKARICVRNGNKKLATYYFDQAKMQTGYIEWANSTAAAAYLVENNSSDENKLDLHHLYVKEAIAALDNFLDGHIVFLRDMNINNKRVMVVTGRGKHSQDDVPKVKPAVQKRLTKRDIRHFQSNPGCLIAIVDQDSCLTDEL